MTRRPKITVVDVPVKAMTTGRRKAARNAIIDECIDAARNEAIQFLSREGACVLYGPAGLAMALVAAIGALKTLDRPKRRRKQP